MMKRLDIRPRRSVRPSGGGGGTFLVRPDAVEGLKNIRTTTLSMDSSSGRYDAFAWHFDFGIGRGISAEDNFRIPIGSWQSSARHLFPCRSSANIRSYFPRITSQR